jgi:hypothetical protein
VKILLISLFKPISFLGLLSILILYSCATTETFTETSTTNLCTCYDSTIIEYNRYMPPASLYTSYQKFKSIFGYTLIGEEEAFENIFVKDLVADVNYGESFYMFPLVSSSPIKFEHPSGSYILNLNPCSHNNKFYELPVGLTYSHGIRQINPGFDSESFDRSARSFFNLLLIISGTSPEYVFKESLQKLLYYDHDEDYQEINKVLSKIAKSCGITYRSIQPDGGDAMLIIDNFVEAIELKDVDVFELVLRNFIETDSLEREINKTEEYILMDIFRNRIGDFTLKNIEEGYLYPKVNAGIHYFSGETGKIGIDFNSGILKPDNNGSIPGSVMITANYRELSYVTNGDFEVDITDICIPPVQFSNNEIKINFRDAVLIDSGTQKLKAPGTYNFRYVNYPLFIIDTIETHSSRNPYYYKYDSSLINFSGLYVPTFDLILPIDNSFISGKGIELILNNFLISGIIRLKYSEFDNEHLKLIDSRDKEIPISVSALEKRFNDINLKLLNPITSVDEGEKVVNLHFKYIH